MKAKIIIEIDPGELYNEMDLLIALKAIATALTEINNGLAQCTVRGADGAPTPEIDQLIKHLESSVSSVMKQILLGELMLNRKAGVEDVTTDSEG